jgi:hypothetical protein
MENIVGRSGATPRHVRPLQNIYIKYFENDDIQHIL